jgi:putative ABC transport system substrate-binding protein
MQLAMRALFILLTALASAPGSAQAPGKTYRIGWLTTAPHPGIAGFRDGLRAHGYIEGRNLVIEERYAEGKAERLASLATELVRLKPDLIVASGRAATDAARKASSIPVVFVTGDPVGEGFVNSLARPGGTLTGVALVNTEVSSKWIELAKQVVPGMSRIAILRDPGASRLQVQAALSAASSLGLEPLVLDARDVGEVEQAFKSAAARGAGAVVPLSSATFAAHRKAIVALAARHRLPTVYEHRAFVDAGGLMSYGPDLNDVFRRAAGVAHKVLTGSKPADLPVEQPLKIELVINLKTARELDLNLPPALLLRADQVIQPQ